LLNHNLLLKLNATQIWDDIYCKDLSSLPWIWNKYPDEIINNIRFLINESSSVLDFGCGNGRFIPFFKSINCNISVNDISNKAVKLCMSNYPDYDIIELPNIDLIEENIFDVIFCWGVFHHIPPALWEKYISKFIEGIRDDGIIIISGFSENDIEFVNKKRISPYTNLDTFPIEPNIKNSLINNTLDLLFKETFFFIEATTKKNRTFVVYCYEKK